MRIAHFCSVIPRLAAREAYFAQLSRSLVEAGPSVTVFTTTALDLQASAPAAPSASGRR